MKNWNDRPFEHRNLFNPAFCGAILLRSVLGYEEVDSSGMPFSLAIVVLPLCLHKETREKLILKPKGYLLKTIVENPQILIGFPERVKELLPYTFEALGFAMHLNSFVVTETGKLKFQKGGIRKTIEGTQETTECQRVAGLIGKNFAKIGDRVTIYTLLGIKP